MIPVDDPRILQTALHITTHHPWFVDWLRAWRTREVDKLAYATTEEDLRVKQGGVRTLDELLKLLTNAEIDLRRVKT